MKTLQQRWLDYKAHCYPKGCNEVQERETHQAFFSGALVMFGELAEAAGLPDAEAEKRTDDLYVEVVGVLDARAMNLGARN